MSGETDANFSGFKFYIYENWTILRFKRITNYANFNKYFI